MTIRVGRRPSPLIGGIDKRAAIVGCDQDGCKKALEFPVNLQATDRQCKDDTIRYMIRAEPHGWRTDSKRFFCKEHALLVGFRKSTTKGPGQ